MGAARLWMCCFFPPPFLSAHLEPRLPYIDIYPQRSLVTFSPLTVKTKCKEYLSTQDTVLHLQQNEFAVNYYKMLCKECWA